MKKITFIIFCAFVIVIIFFSMFGGIIRQSTYVFVTTVKLQQYLNENRMLRVIPKEAVHIDEIDDRAYVWVLVESDDIGETYYYVDKTFVEITYQNDICTGIRGLWDDTLVIVTSDSELQDKMRVKIAGE